MLPVRPFRCLGYVGFLSSVAFVLCACGTVRETFHETWYSAPTWSPADDRLAYVKSDVVYTRTRPRFSLFIGEDSVTEENQSLTLQVCTNDRSGQAESCPAEIELPAVGPRGAAVRLEWKDDGLYYGVSLPNGTPAGLWRITPDEDAAQLVTPEGGVRDARPRRLSHDQLEIYAGNEGYGALGNQTIFLFDHARREARVFIHDPLSIRLPTPPPYSITGR